MRGRRFTSANAVVQVTAIALLLVAAVHADQAANATAARDLMEQELRAANLLLGYNQLSEANKHYEKALRLSHEKCPVCWIGMANVLARRGQMNDALKACDRALSSSENSEQRGHARTCRGKIYAAFAPNDEKLWQRAEGELRGALQERETPEARYQLGIVLLKTGRQAEGVNELRYFLEHGGEGQRASAARRIAANPKLASRELAPEFALTSSAGEALSLPSLAGKYVVLDFWATWCPACVDSIGEMKELVAQYRSRGVVVISVSSDVDEKKWSEFVAKKQMDWAQYHDRDHRISGLFGVYVYPTYVLIDPDGAVARRLTGENPHQTIVHRLREALNELPRVASSGHAAETGR